MNLILVTGESGSGKTTFCREMVREARQSGWDVTGLLSLPEFMGSEKLSIWAEGLRSGEKRLLASVQRQGENDLVFGKWFFRRLTLDWGNEVLRASIPCDLLVVDELGPLELKLSQGWTEALDVIGTGQYKLALAVIRPDLVEMVRGILHPGQVIQLNKMEEVSEKMRQCKSLLNFCDESPAH